ncbi:sushi, von Willebrand factor type A, EGF and pentraxin domain-containing protein 1-like [Pristis pectinata]|uniref:sushi, von Willebrand factor type A, EGF and pentraxin domain-containing protein 1-like n=1 Tax=Pristis pectinata TaxID=685728 RepID=UPI00223E4244|nr:sushi, von Willebrand factor type A, EGF and pentraxin domain-containing protein 1-like [Pristis pectinata]
MRGEGGRRAMALRLLVALLSAAGAAGDCGRPPELENGSPFDEFISEISFQVGAVVNYRCDLGYIFKEETSKGSRSVTCKDDSTWTPLQVDCELRNCGNPGEIMHGYSLAPNTTFGSKVTFYCEAGYQVVGRNYRLCEADGWSGQVPMCEAVTCAGLPPVSNGVAPSRPYGEHWEYGMVARYSCDKNYSLIGADRLVCTETGEWSNNPPTCKAVLCHPPDLPANGRIEAGFGPTYTLGETISYGCAEGFQLVGKSEIECRENNTFVPGPPSCKPVTCADLPSISNGLAPSPPYGHHWEYGMVAKYSCSAGYSLIGANRLVCTKAGEWNNTPPTCKAVLCQPPDLPADSLIEAGFGPTYTYGETISYSCAEGFQMIGKSEIECRENNTFVPGPPSCLPVQCHRPEQIANGQIEAGFGPTYTYGETISYSCAEGFQMIGKSEIECRENNTFVPGPPSCKLRNCGNPGEIPNGYFQAPNTTFGSRATFTCNAGYQMVGRNYLLCAADGWDGQVPICEAVTCAGLPPVSNGVAPSPPSGEHWQYGMVAAYSCSAGYSLHGAVKLVCTETGQWNSTPPTCKAVQCHRPDLPAFSQIEAGFGPTYSFGETISYSCVHGSQMVGKSTIECRENNTFVPEPPTCKPKNCGSPGVIANGYSQAPDTTFGSRATFHCKTGFLMVGKNYRFCTAKGWDGQVPVCEEIKSSLVRISETGEHALESPQADAQGKQGLGTAGIIVVCIIVLCLAIGVTAGLSHYQKKRCWLSRQCKSCKKTHINPQPNQSQGEAHFEEYADHPT